MTRCILKCTEVYQRVQRVFFYSRCVCVLYTSIHQVVWCMCVGSQYAWLYCDVDGTLGCVLCTLEKPGVNTSNWDEFFEHECRRHEWQRNELKIWCIFTSWHEISFIFIYRPILDEFDLQNRDFGQFRDFWRFRSI